MLFLNKERYMNQPRIAVFCPFAQWLAIFFFCAAGHGQMVLTPRTECYSYIRDDWKEQDAVASKGLEAATRAVIEVLPESKRGELNTALSDVSDLSDESAALLDIYLQACSARRSQRFSPYLEKISKIIFSQGGIRPGVWEGPEKTGGYEGKGLELLELDGLFGEITHLMPEGIGRDPDVSFDGSKVLFAWNRDESRHDRYHIHEMTIADQSVRQITDGEGCDDIEPVYLPDGNILLHSSRQAQRTDCISTRAFNLFLCDSQGRYLRRIGYDQVSTCNPVLMPSGEVLYARWDYNDKSHVFGHALFIMSPDGTRQQEYYNNNSLFPTNVLHPRPIPGTNKIMATITGYHTNQPGEIAIIDNSFGYENGAGLTFVAPVREIKDLHKADWGGATPESLWTYSGDSFPYPGKGPQDRWDAGDDDIAAFPCPLDENAFLVCYRPAGKRRDASWGEKLGLFFMLVDGQRELLFFDSSGGCATPRLLAPREKPLIPSSSVDYRDSMGVFQVMDIYRGESLKGVERGTIKRLRVVALYYRPAFTIGKSHHTGPVSSGAYNNPIATHNATWDVKAVVGETPVHEDGSANFYAPARVPVFFQALDAKGQTVQTMRSWATLQPGETFSCVGCHDSKTEAPQPPGDVVAALREPTKKTEQFYGPERGFSYVKEIQPIWDAKCIRCHNAETPNGIDLRGVEVPNYKWADERDTHRNWLQSYINLVGHAESASYSKYVNWFHAEDCPLLMPPNRAGSGKSMLVSLLENGHKEVSMTKEEMDKIKCWIDLGVPHFGSYTEGVIGHERDIENAMKLKQDWEDKEKENIQAYIAAGQNGAVSAQISPKVASVGPASMNASCVMKRGVLHLQLPRAPGNASVAAKISVYSVHGRLLYQKELSLSSNRAISHTADLGKAAQGPVVVKIAAPFFSKALMRIHMR